MLAQTTHDIPQLASGWTPERKTRFLDHLAHKGNVRAACKSVGLSREAAYRLRRRDPMFARGWSAAMVLARASSEEVLADRAIDGVEEEIYYRGELIGTRRRYDARLLLAHLARLDRLADEENAGADAARFDEILAIIAGETMPPDLDTGEDGLPLDREATALRGADGAEAEVRYFDEHGGDDDPAPDPAPLAVRCLTARHRGRAEGEALWDAWFAAACGRVDRLDANPGAPTAPGLPAHPFPPRASNAALDGLAVFSPRTLSDVSTTALARALAGPARGFCPGANAQAPRRFSPRQASRD